MADRAKVRILIVDDNAEAREALSDLLRAEFNIVGERATADGLQDAIRNYQPDLVLLDISMPKINGLMAARQLRQAGVNVKIIFVTEHTDPQYVKEAFRAGGSGFVVKSRAPTHIRRAIQLVMGGGRFPSEGEASASSGLDIADNSST